MKILLHICCGVCAAGSAQVLLAEGHQLTGYFYNPNISPASEYLRRLKTAHLTADKLGFELIDGLYEPAAWLASVSGFQEEPEGGKRCSVCYQIRLEKSFAMMQEKKLDAFTSTLTISPHKSAQIINSIGRQIGGESFIARDFKKKDGFKQAVAMAKKWELYRQVYCGCQFSIKEHSFNENSSG